MKKIKYILFALLLTAATGALAKRIQPAHVYMFGFSASFQDSIIYITDIQDVRGAWMDSKTKFLEGRDHYSYQLKEYFADSLQLQQRVCMTFFATSKKKAERKKEKLLSKYIDKKKKLIYDIRRVSIQDFKFEPVNMSPEQ